MKAQSAIYVPARELVAGAEVAVEALESARDALYRGEGPDMSQDSDIVYGEWLGNRADHLRAALTPPEDQP